MEIQLYDSLLVEYLWLYHGWRRGLVVRASVFGWRAFPDLSLIYG